jgi:hypothetical protein
MKLSNLIWSVVAAAILILPPIVLFSAPSRGGDSGQARTINAYLKSAYAHDFRKAYRLIAARDRLVKTEEFYTREKGPFSGFALTVAAKLSELIEIRPVSSVQEDATTKVKFNIKLPDADSLSSLLFDWDQDKLNALPDLKQKEILAAIDDLRRAGKLKVIDGEEELTLVKESGVWRVLLDWAAGLSVRYDAAVPPSDILEATPLNRETVVRANELFTIVYRVKNISDQTIATRIVHRVEPQDLRQYLDLVECGLLLPVRLKPGEGREFSSTYMVRSDLPDGSKQLKVTYDFKIEN